MSTTPEYDALLAGRSPSRHSRPAYGRTGGGVHRWRDDAAYPSPSNAPAAERPTAPTTLEPHVSAPTTPPPYIRYPRTVAQRPLLARQVAKAMNAPLEHADGTGVTVGVISLGGTLDGTDLRAAGLPDDKVIVQSVGGSRPNADPGADGENALDVQVILGIAPAATVHFYSAENTDQGFVAALSQAVQECDVVSISWGGPESSWSQRAVTAFAKVCAAARARGVPIFCASGDAGSRDGTDRDVVDYPASDPSVVGVGGTTLSVDRHDARTSEVTWNDDPTTSATGGGVSDLFPGRRVPDIAANADPDSGYRIVLGGRESPVGGTSGAAPTNAACTALVLQLTGRRRFDYLNTIATNPEVCWDVTVGDNGTWKAGPGRDNTTGFGVVDYGKLLAVLTSGVQVPAPGGRLDPAPPEAAGAPPSSGRDSSALLRDIASTLGELLRRITAYLAGRS